MGGGKGKENYYNKKNYRGKRGEASTEEKKLSHGRKEEQLPIGKDAIRMGKGGSDIGGKATAKSQKNKRLKSWSSFIKL